MCTHHKSLCKQSILTTINSIIIINNGLIIIVANNDYSGTIQFQPLEIKLHY